MPVNVDLHICQGYALCVLEAPDVFALDEDTDKVHVLNPAPPPGRIDQTRQAAHACPVGAITIDGEP
ncbi:MAG: ferredoxin [Blastococcus sp.]|jgi:ferredoxin|nr:ferredoxin [Blastococcus sp.]